ncbi:dihydrolipoyl dehydrogenase [Roseovarius pelagicus]|uniref:Dihydrolipoyl dehydrogenase n=1 Tax=Roseovarius pelagicus TaxID=2980108 RepID=A0ABY6DFL3_9RHOB|nr:dihydrolipoyl dehydrogenase [Roseovarius pelagicus]UXX82580.1 dihydrolipoyl dehydrogenase [Roseovarius pelagicus]
MEELNCKLLVIGSGPGGYVCAIRAGQLGVDTIIVEGKAHGGTCLNVGCIPSKALIHAAEEFSHATQFNGDNVLGISVQKPEIDLAKTIAWKDGIVARLNGGVGALLKRAKVRAIVGHARFRDGKSVIVKTDLGEQLIHAEKVVIATGSVPFEIPALPFGGDVISSTGALALTSVPKRLIVVGGGYIGLEIGTAMAKLGAEVTVVEFAARILPQYDSELTKPVADRLAALGVTVMLNAKAEGLNGKKDKLRVTLDGGETSELPFDKVMVAVGRKARTEDCGLEELALKMNGPFISIDDRCQTSMRDVYAIGDVTGEPMLAHRAIAQGEMTAEIVAGGPHAWDKQCIPAVCFTDPEIVTVGLSPDQARALGHDIVSPGFTPEEDTVLNREIMIGKFPFAANGRAMTMENESGFIRVVARASDHVILGIQATGGGISELAAVFALAIEMGARLEDIAGTIHAHPTQSEGFQEAALKALGHAIHI